MKHLIIAVITVFSITICNAQRVSLGGKTGVNFASVSGDDISSKGRTGFHIGGLVKFGITEQFSIQSELLYSTKGFKPDLSDIDTSDFPPLDNVSATWKLDYISWPILADYEVADGFSLQAGPELGFLINSEVETEAGGASASIDVSDLHNSFDFGLALGGQYILDIGLFFQARYTFGLSDIWDVRGVSNQNGVFQLSAGYFFN